MCAQVLKDKDHFTSLHAKVTEAARRPGCQKAEILEGPKSAISQ